MRKLKFTVVEHKYTYCATCTIGDDFAKSVNGKSHELALKSLFTELSILYLDLLCIPTTLLSLTGEEVCRELEPFCQQKPR